MNPSDEIIAIYDQNTYDSTETVLVLSREEYCEMKRTLPRGEILQRCSPEKARKVNREIFRREYDLAIQKKYNVGPGWRENRWFVEQVRPTL